MKDYTSCDLLKRQVLSTVGTLFDTGKALDAMKAQGISIKAGSSVRSARDYLTPHFKATKGVDSAQRALEAAVKRMELLQTTLPLQTLRKEGSSILGMVLSSLSTEFDWNIGQAALVAKPMQHIRNYTASLLEQIVRADTIVQSNKLVDFVYLLNKRHRTQLNAGERSYIAYRAIEIGVLDPLKSVFTLASPTQVIQADNLAKYNAWVAEMTSYGFTPAEINTLSSLAINVHDAADKPRRLAKAVGIEIPTLEGLGWLQRSYSTPMLKFFDDFRNEYIFDGSVNEAQINLKSLLAAPRKTNKFLVQDKVALATILGLTPTTHIFLPQSPKVFNIPWNRVGSRAFTSFQTTVVGLNSFIRSNPHIKVMQSGFDTWAELKNAVKLQAKADKVKALNGMNRYNAHTVLSEIGEKAFLVSDGVVVADTSVDLSSVGIVTPTVGFTRLSRNQVATLKASGIAKPKDWRSWYMNKYTVNVDTAALSKYAGGADFISTGGHKPELIELNPSSYTLQEHYRWGAGRADDLNNFRYIKDAYKDTVPVLGTKLDPLTKLANFIKSEIGTGTGARAARTEVDAALAAKDEAALIALAAKHSSKNGVILEFAKTGEYAVFDFGKVPDLFDTGALTLVDRLFDPEYAYALVDYLRDVGLHQSDYIARTLVDTGILAKVPMSVGETWEYYVNKFNLPFTHPSQLVNMDFTDLWLDTAQKLKKAVGNSLILTKLFDSDEAITNGWLVPDEVYRRNPSQYVDYYQIGSDQALIQLMENLGYGDQIRSLTNMRVHPAVARKLRGIIAAYTSPTVTAQLGQALHQHLLMWSKTLLTFVTGAPTYILNNILDPVITSFSNGGDIASLPFRNKDLFVYLQSGSLDHIDNTIPKYIHPGTGQPLTAREATQLFLDMQFHGIASNVPDVQIGTVTRKSKSQLISEAWDSLVSWKDMSWHMMQWALHNGKQRGLSASLLRGAEALKEISYETINNLFAPQAIVATIGEKTVQLNHFLGLLQPVKDADSIALRRRATSMGFFDGYATSMEDLWDKMDMAFVNPYNAGRITKLLAKVGIPMYATYHIKTPFNVAKAITRRPVQFYNFSRMWSIMQAANEEYNNIRDFEYAEYQQDAWLLGDFRDPEGGISRLGVYDNYNNWWNTFDLLGKAKNKVDPSYSIHNLEAITNSEDSFAQQAIREITRMSQPLVKIAFREATNSNPLTGLPYEAEAGAKRPSYLMWNVDAKTRDNLYDLFPATRFLDNWNPGSVFGTAAIKDELGNTVIDGTLGWNNVERYPLRGVDRLRLSEDAGYNFLYNALDLVGFSPTIIDVERNVQNNMSKLDSTVRELEQRYLSISDTIRRETATYNPDERARMLKELDEVASLYLLVRLEQTKWNYQLTINEGVLTPQIINDANRKVTEALRKYGKHPLVDDLHKQMEEYTNDYLELRRVLSDG